MMVIKVKRLRKKKKCARKIVLNVNDYKKYFLNIETILKTQRRFKNEARNVYTEEINKIALSSNDDKRFQTLIDKMTSYPYSASVGKICKTEFLEHLNIK